MSCFTYLSANDCLTPVSNDEINTRLAAVRNLSGGDWRVQEFVNYHRPFPYHRQVKYIRYSLYYGVGVSEFQIINFYLGHDWSINQVVSDQILLNYLMGLINGIQNTYFQIMEAGLIKPATRNTLPTKELIAKLKESVSCPG